MTLIADHGPIHLYEWQHQINFVMVDGTEWVTDPTRFSPTGLASVVEEIATDEIIQFLADGVLTFIRGSNIDHFWMTCTCGEKHEPPERVRR